MIVIAPSPPASSRAAPRLGITASQFGHFAEHDDSSSRLSDMKRQAAR